MCPEVRKLIIKNSKLINYGKILKRKIEKEKEKKKSV